MRNFLCFALVVTLGGWQAARAVELPIHPDEAAVIKAIAATERIDVEAVEMPAWSKNGLIKSLAAYGVEPDSLMATRLAGKERPSLFLGLIYNGSGRVLAISGNGPWLRNSSLRSLNKLPELRIIRIDHNGFVGRDPQVPEFDGSGFDALADSKLAEIKIGLSFSDRGMEQCAKIKSLQSFSVAHSRATEAGIEHFAGHPKLTAFSIAEMASDRVSGKAFGAIAKIPHLTRVGLKECYLTYDDGFALLAPLKGQLVEIDLTMSVSSQADLDRLQADHPQAKITTTPPAEIVKRHKFIATNLARKAPPELAAPLQEALGQ